MDQHMFQLITGLASANKIGQEFRSETPFAKFDVLTPEQPGWAWQMTKRLLSVPRNFLTSQGVQESSNVAESGIQITVR